MLMFIPYGCWITT